MSIPRVMAALEPAVHVGMAATGAAMTGPGAERVLIKICGLSTPETLETTIAAGADMAGFVFFEKSPRHLSLETAQSLGSLAAGRIRKVALTVDANDAELDAIASALKPD